MSPFIVQMYAVPDMDDDGEDDTAKQPMKYYSSVTLLGRNVVSSPTYSLEICARVWADGAIEALNVSPARLATVVIP